MENEKEYEKWKSDNNSWGRKFASSINAWHLILFFLLLVGGSWAMTTGKIKPSFFYGAVILGLLVIIFLMYKGPTGKKLIPYPIIVRIGQKALEDMKRKGIQIPWDANVRIMLQGEPKWEQDLTNNTSGMTRRNLGFEVWKKGYRKKGILGIDPYTGDIMGFEYLACGYTGRESRVETKIVPVGMFDTKNPSL